MHGYNQQLSDLFRRNCRYIIPQYQRDYQWEAPNWQALIRDIIDISTKPEMNPISPGTPISHWMGILLMTRGQNVPGELVQDYIIIDGQQRLVTFRLWLAALEHAAKDRREEPLQIEYPQVCVQDSDYSAFQAATNYNEWRNLNSRSILSGKLRGPLGAYAYFRYILWLGGDALSSEAAIKLPKLRKEPLENESIEDEWSRYCEKKGLKRSEKVDLKELAYTTTKRLSFYTLEHDRTKDESQEIIFDTLNGRQLSLEPFEHARNSLFIRISDPTSVHKTYWKPYEHIFTRPGTKGRGTQFLYDYLISQGEYKRQGTISTRKGAAHFSYMTSSYKDEEEKKLTEFVKTNLVYALGSWPIVLGYASDFKLEGFPKNIDTPTSQLLQSIREMSEGPATPAVLLYLTAFMRGRLTEKELRSRLELIEGYIARLILAGAPLSPLRSYFMKLLGDIDKDTDINLLKDKLVKTWKTDKDIRENAIDKKYQYYKIAKSKPVGAILRCIERQMAGTGSHWFDQGKTEGKYTVEHIYPQQPSDAWKKDINLWKQRREKMDELLHTLGNLTVVTFKHNNNVKNKSFKEKQDYVTRTGKAAPMAINNSWINEKEWTANKIKERTERLITQALKWFSFERA
jgi:hypothetical protein